MSEDFYLPRLLAQWNATRGAWETGQQDLLSMRSELFLETWPASGTTRSGRVFELPTPALPTAATESSLLPTPDVPNGGKAIPENAIWSGKAAYTPNGKKVQVGIGQIERLLKTPTSQLAVNGGSQHPDKRKEGGHGPTLADEVEHLLPTPTAMNPNDGESVETWEARRQEVKAKGINGNGFGTPLAIAVQQLPTPTARDWRSAGH